jgi:predicted dehydrogenase
MDIQDNRIKVGVIGVGNMGKRHCRVYSTLPKTELVGIFDSVPETGQNVGRQFGVPFYNRLEQLLEGVDAVSIATPTQFHFDIAMHCLAQGKHILVEKPLTETLAQAEQLNRAAKKSGLVVQVGHIERFNPAYIETKNVLDDLDVLAINLRRLSAYAVSATDVDVVLDLMIHDIDLVLDLVGQEPVSISAQGMPVLSGTIDHVVALLAFENGPIVTLTASRVTEEKIRNMDITAREAYVDCNLLTKNISIHRRTLSEYLGNYQSGVSYRQESIVERIHVPAYEPLFLQLQHFADCIINNETPLISTEDGLTTLRTTLAIRNQINRQLKQSQNLLGSEILAKDSLMPVAR